IPRPPYCPTAKCSLPAVLALSLSRAPNFTTQPPAPGARPTTLSTVVIVTPPRSCQTGKCSSQEEATTPCSSGARNSTTSDLVSAVNGSLRSREHHRRLDPASGSGSPARFFKGSHKLPAAAHRIHRVIIQSCSYGGSTTNR